MGEQEIQQAQRRQRVAALIQRLTSRKLDDATAIAEIQALEPEEFEEMLKTFLVLVRWKRFFPLGALLLFLCTVTVEYLLSQNGAHLLGLTGGLFAMVAAVSTLQTSFVTTRLMTRLDDERVIGPLAQALPVADKTTQPVIVNTLVRLLPRLREEDASLLTPLQREALNRILLKSDSPGLVLVLLEALKKIGDSAAIPHVARVTQGKASTVSARPDLQEAARECLEILEEKEARKRRQETLVRAAEPPTENTLLRPAGSAGEANPQDLLRAASTPDQEQTGTPYTAIADTEEEIPLEQQSV